MPNISSALKPFYLNGSDIDFLLAQIKFRPLFDAAGNAIINWDGTGAVYDGHHNLIWDGVYGGPIPDAAAAISLYGISYETPVDLSGLRDVSGLNNNLALVNSAYGAVNQDFPRLDANYSGYVVDPNGSVKINGITTPGLTSNDYAITVGGVTNATATDGTPIHIATITDGSARTISLLTTTGGVTFDTWANHSTESNANQHTTAEIYYGNNGDQEAQVLSWGDLETTLNGGLGQVDTQARLDGSAGIGEKFIGGLNPGVSPSNGFFVLFGQFFDHGLDFIDKGGQSAKIKITLAADDPLYGMMGADGQPATTITINRATVDSVDANGNPMYIDHTSPFIDQSQTYGSSAQLTNLLREWVPDLTTAATGDFHAGMNLFNGTTLAEAWTKADGTPTHETLPTLNELRAHIVATGRDDITWEDVSNLRNRDASGHVIAGTSGSALILDSNPRFDAAHLFASTGFQDTNHNGVQDGGEAGYVGFNDTNHNGIKEVGELTQAQVVQNAIDYIGDHANATSTHLRAGDSFGMVGGKLTLHLGTDLSAGPMTFLAGTDLTGASALIAMGVLNPETFGITLPAGAAHDAVGTILMASVGDHYIAGDGRVNENFGLTSIHHIFHEEHNYQVDNLIAAISRDATVSGDYSKLHELQVDTNGGVMDADHNFVNASGQITWDTEKMFQASKLIVEMEYQHAAVDQYARNVTPNIQEFVGYSPDKDPSVSLEYSQVAFRFGHSTLRETIDTIDPSGGLTGKIMGYALRAAFLNPDEYANLGPAAILLGMSHQQMNEVDEFVTPALNQGLLGQPLDLAAINIARGRDIGIPTLNDMREGLGLARYTSWNDFGQNMQHPESLDNFIAAYSFAGDAQAMEKAAAILGLADGTIAEGDPLAFDFTVEQATAFLTGDEAVGGAGTLGFNHIDSWLGGLAEIHQPGGLLGETFDLIFVTQIESLMDGDRFYYLYRLAGQQFADEVGGGQLKDIVERNTGLTHLNGNIFGYADQYVDLGAHRDTTALIANGGDAADIYSQASTRLVDPVTGTLLVNSGDTVGNEHKYGDLTGTKELGVAGNGVTGGTLGVYSNGGRGNLNDGNLVTVGGVRYVQDTRLAVTNGNSPEAQNDFQNLDGTPNSGAESNEVIVGSRGDDLIYAQGGDDTVYGEAGNDTIYGGFGIDRLYGGAGSDHLYGGDNPDLMDGGSGDDFIYGESSGSDINGSDQLIGGSGNDFISGGTGIDKLAGGTGDDKIYGDGDTDPFTHGGDGNDYVDGGSGGDILYGDNGDDILSGGADQDQLFGGRGDDILRPGDVTGALTIGSDEVLGGDGVTDEGNVPGTIGFDIIDFSDNAIRAGGVKFDLSAQTNPSVAVNGNLLQVPSFQIEGIIGSAGNDTLTGGSDHVDAAGNDVVDNGWVIGGSGNDKLTGGAGDDVIIGGSVRLDTMIGRYNSGYTHNNNNDGLTEAQQIEDARYQGASHRVLYSENIDNTGLIDAANAQLGGVDYEKHFTEMLRSEQFRDTVLGNSSATGVADTAHKGSDTVIFSGNSNDYSFEVVNFAGHQVIRVTDSVAGRDGSDLIVDVDNFQFSGGGVKTFTFAQLATLPSVSVGDVSVTEGNAGTVPATFAITLNQVYAHDVTINYATSNGTATAGLDYVALAGSVVIAAGQTSATVTVNVDGDLLSETNETFNLNLTSATVAAPGGGTTNVAITDNQGVGTILNDDMVNILVGNAAPVAEGHTGATNQLAFAVTLAQPSAATVTVNYTTVGGTATAGTDYTAQTGTLTFLAGETSKTVIVSVTGDIVQENDETVQLVLSGNSPNSTILINTGNGVILNDDLIGTATANTLTAPNNGVTSGVTLDYYIDGAGGNDILTGGAGNDRIIGGIGNDTMAGGTGDDTYVVDANLDVVTEAVGAGIDTIETSQATFSLTTRGANVENLTYTPTGAAANFTGTGNALNNVITGGAANDTLDGAGGTDTLIGLGGNDTYIVNNAGVTVTEAAGAAGGVDTVRTNLASYALDANVENLTYTGAGNFAGTGNALDNVLTGAAGNDTLAGGMGNDALNGAGGIDTAVFTGSVADHSFALSGANLTVTGTGANTDGTDTLNSVENVSFADGNFTLRQGTAANNTLNIGTLNAGTTGALFLGLGGTDTASYAAVATDVTANLSGGSADRFIGIANVTGGTGNDTLTGDASVNTLTGGAGNDVLKGAAGNDAIAGGAGTADVAVFDGAAANFGFDGTTASLTITDGVGSEGADTLTGIETLRFAGVDYNIVQGTNGNDSGGTALNGGATANNVMFGFNGNDTLNGGALNDIINGGAGNDIINAGDGIDRIVQYAKDAGRDIIDGGNGTDTFQLVGDNTAQERFTVYDRTSAITAGFGVGLNAASMIVVTKETWNGVSWNPGTVISELRNIEEIDIKTSGIGANVGALSGNVGPTASGDSIRVIGNFTGTGLAYNTITIDAAGNNSTVDISHLTSEHRIVFNTGGEGTVVGALRPQDVVNGAVGTAAASVATVATTGHDFSGMEALDLTAFPQLSNAGSNAFAGIDLGIFNGGFGSNFALAKGFGSETTSTLAIDMSHIDTWASYLTNGSLAAHNTSYVEQLAPLNTPDLIGDLADNGAMQHLSRAHVTKFFDGEILEHHAGHVDGYFLA